MNDMTLKEALMADARAKGICLDGYKEMHSADRNALVDYYVQNPDWCMERGFPSMGMLRREFSDCEDKGVFVGRTFDGEILNERQAYVFHNCRGRVRTGLNVEKAIIPMLYVANGCEMEIEGLGDVRPLRRPVVPVYVFGENDIAAEDNEWVEFRRYDNRLL